MSRVITLGGLKKSDFQKVVDGKNVDLFILSNKNGLEMSVTNYGAKIVSLHVLDRNGKLIDVVLGHNNIEEYLSSKEPYFGAVCGRTCNRIANGKFTLDGVEYQLAVNNGPNNLHGGLKGFNVVVWDAVQIDEQTVEMTYISPDGEEGFPGTLTTKVTYNLSDNNELNIIFEAQTDKPTIVNLTNHSYFNLSGAGDPNIGDHKLFINAPWYLPTDETNIPYGNAEYLQGTPLDFSTGCLIGERINENHIQLKYGSGYDHTYIIKDFDVNKWVLAAEVVSPKTGIGMVIHTTEPGIQLYTGNWMTGEFEGKYGFRYPKRSAFCLETQHFPDAINKQTDSSLTPNYPSVVLRPRETFNSKTSFKFFTE